ncbi:MAG: hypothetical protein L6Q29_01855 [Candidatus Pacebacteria bacterium]|nr:hypothetical protein [Candidatus Paceibacterota bacterium]NUQ56932.1 hypothetical protein [Candidatus Paceibacter sp.]
MREYQEKKKIKKRIYSNWAFALLAALFVFLVYSTVKIYLKGRAVGENAARVRGNLSSLEQEKEELEREIARLQNADGAEEELRKKFNIGKRDEKLVVILDKKEENVKISGGEDVGFFGKIWRSVKSWF